uniref:Interferon alpha/beta receptor 2 n=1 Tax=Oryctolagus cuniculus TaxID=9986 RepID=G1TG86_RABIT
MFWSPNASAVRSLHLHLLVCISLVFGISHAWLDFTDQPCVFNMTLRSLRPILSWKLKNHPIVPTYYKVQHTIMSKLDTMKIVEGCTNITRPSCDVMDVLEDIHENYLFLLEGFRGSSALDNCSDIFTSADMYFEPPEFEIAGFTDLINVTVKFPPIIPKIFKKELQHSLSLVISEESGGIVKTHKPKITGNIGGNFSYVIDKLIPNSNYCVSVYFEPKFMGTPIKSPLKCTFLQSRQESESSESAKIGGIITVSVVAVVFIATVLTLKRVGYICLKNKFPKALNFQNFLFWVFPELPPSEAVDVVEVICINRMKKLWNYNYDDESDSDDETAPRANAGGYTTHGLLGRPLNQTSATSATSEESQSADGDAKESDVEEPDSPEAHAESPTAPRPALCPSPTERTDERTESPPQDPVPDGDSSSTGGSGDRIVFNVDLKSVFMRVLDDDTEDAPVTFSPPPEDISDLEDPGRTEPTTLAAGGDGLEPPYPGASSECQWPADIPSERSDTSDSDSDVGVGGDYIRR